MNLLYLASASPMRRQLLAAAGWPFEVVSHMADEKSCAWDASLEKLTQHLALLKMDHVILPNGRCFDTSDFAKASSDTQHERICFVLTADTLCVGEDGVIYGKPVDLQDAIAMVKRVRTGITVGTGFCIERRVWQEPGWVMQERVVGYAQAWCSLAITDDEIVLYFQDLAQYSGFEYLKLAGSFSITGYGAQFLNEVRGSYTAILGLPMAPVRAALKKLGYFN